MNKEYEICKDYYDFVKCYTENNMFCIYTINQKRIELHDELCKIFNIDKDKFKCLTDNLDKYKNATDFYNKIIEMIPNIVEED